MKARIDIADYDAVVADIYESAISPAHWDVALTGLVSRFGRDRWDIGMLMWERLDPPGGRFLGASGVHEVARTGYLQLFAGRNDWSVRGHDLPVGTVLHSDKLVERRDFRTTAFFREYLSNFDLEVGLLALLDRHRNTHLCLCLPGPDNGPVTMLEEAVRMLLPHIQRAARISRRIGEAELSASTARAALDRAPSPVLMCDETLRLTYANESGHALIRDGYFEHRDGRIGLADREGNLRLRTLAARDATQHCLAFMLEPAGLPAVGAMAIRIETADIRRSGSEFRESQIMIVAGRNHRASFANVDHLRDWFSLTPAEARLAATLAEGGSLEDFAATRGISLNAARFLLKGVFGKTGTNRQPQLVVRLRETPLQWHIGSLAADLPSPLH